MDAGAEAYMDLTGGDYEEVDVFEDTEAGAEAEEALPA